MSIIWDFRVGKEEGNLSRGVLPSGIPAALYVWCAKSRKDVYGIKCECYMANNPYFNQPTICPVSTNGRTFRDPHD